jgi:hypothetical protein
MTKLSAENIIHILCQSRKEDYGFDYQGWEVAENWSDVGSMGLSDKYKKTLGVIEVKEETVPEDYYPSKIVVWYFKDHDVYIRGALDEGSYAHGYKLQPWTLEQVFPKEKMIIVYDV